MSNITYFDIETGPLPDEQLALVKPEFRAPSNYVDPIKIAASIQSQEAAWRERAALSALTGQVLAVGILVDDYPTIHCVVERENIVAFWHEFQCGGRFVGFAIKGFDLPFLVQRSFVLGIEVPPSVLDGRYFSIRFVDLQECWTCYNPQLREGASLDAICAACRLGRKNGKGADFARLFTEDGQKALAYLENDLFLVKALAERMGI